MKNSTAQFGGHNVASLTWDLTWTKCSRIDTENITILLIVELADCNHKRVLRRAGEYSVDTW